MNQFINQFMNQPTGVPEDWSEGGLRGWGHGLAAWILDVYTDVGDTILDLDNDPAIRMSSRALDRDRVCDQATARVAGAPIRLVTAVWPRPPYVSAGEGDEQLPEGALLAAVARLLAPGGRLALMATFLLPDEPVLVHADHLLAAVAAAGLGHLRTIHAVPATPDVLGGPPAYRCALIFRRPGRRTSYALARPPRANSETAHG
jgi:hypothetical protein